MFSNILSILAITVSIAVVFIEWIKDSRLNRVNLESEYFRDIYKEHLIYGIPKARGYIKFDVEDRLTGIDNMINELQKIRQDSLYFQYNNKDFYCELKVALQALEDYLVNSGGKVFSGEDQSEFYNNLKEGINKIYRIVSKGYLGKKASHRLKKKKL